MTSRHASAGMRAADRSSGARGTVQALLFSTWAWAGLMLLGIALLGLDAVAPEVSRTVAPESIKVDKEHAFVVRVRADFPFAARGSMTNIGVRRKLSLFENGYPLGPADAPHAVVRAGGGAYSHWGDVLYFSLTDASDPRTNGRTYSYRVPTGLHPALRFVAYGAPVAALLVIAASALRRREGDAAQSSALRSLGFGAATLGGLGLVYLSVVSVATGPRFGVLDAKTISAQRGNAHLGRIELKVDWPLRAIAASGSFDPTSRFTLTQDGVPLGPRATDPAEISRDGGGRYALFADQLLFSTPDGSDPRANGRVYAWLVPVEVMPTAWLLPLFVFALGVLLASGRAAPLLAQWLLRASASADRMHDKVARVIIAGLVCVAAVALVISRWNWGPSGLLGLMGYLPISDALSYFRCGVVAMGAAADASSIGFDWCARRILYVTALGSSLGLSGWRPQVVLLAQALVVGGALAAFGLTVARCYGRVAAVVSVGGLAMVAYDLALGTFMTEALGLPLGLLGLTLLIAFAHTPARLSMLYAGLAFISFGMFVRMGALLVLPLLALWACWIIVRSEGRARLATCIGVFVALSIGPLLQVLVVLALGVDPTNTGGNYAATLYGLSTGSRDWRQAYRDLAPVFQSMSETAAFAKVYAAAFENIRAHPDVFVQSLATSMLSYLVDAFSLSGRLYRFNLPLSALCVIGVAWCVKHAKSRLAALLLAVFLGELLCVPLVFTGASDHRVLIASVGARFLLTGIGMAWLWSAALRLLGSPRLDAATVAGPGRVPGTMLASALGVVLLIAATLPALPVQRSFELPSFAGRGCPTGQEELVARVGRESLVLSIGASSGPLATGVLGVSPAQIWSERVSRDNWWMAQFPQLKTDTTLVYAVQLLPKGRGSLVGLISEGVLPGDNESPVSFCYDPAPTQVALGDLVFRRVITARPLASP